MSPCYKLKVGKDSPVLTAKFKLIDYPATHTFD